MPTAIVVREVGLRDGLQIHPTFMSTADKLAWIAAETAAGVREIEVTSYVPPKLIPQFVDAAEVTRGALEVPGLKSSALVPNMKGAERGLELGIPMLNFVVSVSRTHNLKNVRREPQESVADFREIVRRVRAGSAERRTLISAGLSTALGCSYEGRIPVDDVVRLAEELAEAGADELMIADTVGYADPAQVRRVFRAVQQAVPTVPLRAHFHDTRGTALANVTAALDCDITRFDASLGGLGGCPYAPGASGNVVLEDLVFMLDSMGLDTGIDIGKLLAVREQVIAALPDMPIHGALWRAGLPRNYAASATR